MRCEGSIETVQLVEKAIKEKAIYTIAHKANKDGGIFGRQFKSNLYTIVYEVFLDKKAKRYIERDDIRLLSCSSVYVRLVYDSRDKTAMIRMNTEGYKKLKEFIPDIDVVIRKVYHDARVAEA